MEPLIAAAIAIVFAGGQPVKDPMLRLALAPSAEECAGRGGTRLVVQPDLVTEVDLNGDGQPDRIVNEAGTFCGPYEGPMWGGTAGPALSAIIGDQVTRLFNGSWTVAEAVFVVEGEGGPPVPMLLVNAHGSVCDSFGAAPCVVAYTWDGTRLVSPLGWDDAVSRAGNRP